MTVAEILGLALSVLDSLGVVPVIQAGVIATMAIVIYRRVTDG